MTKINLIAVLITILFQLNANAGTLCQTIAPTADKDKYSVELIPEGNGNIVLVKFTIPEECYVNIKVTDNEGITIQELVHDEMPAGSYNVYHSSAGNIFNGKDKCIMEIYGNSDNLTKIIYSKEVLLSVR